MTISELITPAHQARKALIYVRQSTPQQVLSNQESLRLQYALQQRAVDLGWHPSDIEVIDADLGQTGAEAQHREGFKDLIARVTLGQIGLILSTEVTRLSRNCSDWYPLLDLCGFKTCLIADRDGVYDPGSANGRFLLGLKGQLSEMELHSIRGRLTAGLLNKAQRGELALTLPIGLVRQPDGTVVKDPHQEIQDRLTLVFTTFLRVQSASQVLRFFNAHDLTLPRRDRLGELVWVRPSVAALLAILKNPAYAGAFVYGRTRTTHAATGKTHLCHLPQGQWKIMIPDKYPAYLSWETFQQIQTKLQDNYAEYDRNGSRGVPRPGAALLHGLVYCGECGHKMVVQYKGGTLYLCNYLRQQYGVPVCQYIPADALDQAVVQAFFQVLSPAELEVYEQALAAREATAQTTRHAQEQQLTRLRYAAALAQRQYNQVDPDNRLVAAELERRWEVALVALKQAEEASAQPQLPTHRPQALPPELKAALVALGQKLPDLWAQPLLSTKTKKALLRCLIDKVVVHRATPDRLQARVVWKGGDTTTLRIPIPVGAWRDLTSAGEMESTILELSAQGQSDADIAQHLTALGHRSPMNTRAVLPSTVKTIRLKHDLFQKRSQSHPRHIPDRLTVPQVARRLEVSVHWIYDRIHNGTIHLAKDAHNGLYLFPDTPETLALLRDLKAGKLKDLRF
jgi:DNA invertase Pin-like site-specific DNA recombinase